MSRPTRRLPVVRETSAGGLVLDDARQPGKGLLIGRRRPDGSTGWSMPKGHLEFGETAAEAARREVAEETGVRARVLGPFGTVDYWFVADGRRIHKTVHHFLLAYESGDLSTDDVEVDEVAWVPIAELPMRLAYASERDLLERLRHALTEASG